MNRPRLFWDSSALMDAMFALEDSPYYDLFDLGEVELVDMRISPDVTRECEAILRPYGEETLSLLAITLSEGNFATTPLPVSWHRLSQEKEKRRNGCKFPYG